MVVRLLRSVLVGLVAVAFFAFAGDRGGAQEQPELISVAIDGGEADGVSSVSSISSDGRFVLFTSSATNLVESNVDEGHHLYLRDRLNQTTVRVSRGTQVYGVDVVDDGRYVIYVSEDEIGGRSGRAEYLYDVSTGQRTLIDGLVDVRRDWAVSSFGEQIRAWNRDTDTVTVSPVPVDETRLRVLHVGSDGSILTRADITSREGETSAELRRYDGHDLTFDVLGSELDVRAVSPDGSHVLVRDIVQVGDGGYEVLLERDLLTGEISEVVREETVERFPPYPLRLSSANYAAGGGHVIVARGNQCCPFLDDAGWYVIDRMSGEQRLVLPAPRFLASWTVSSCGSALAVVRSGQIYVHDLDLEPTGCAIDSAPPTTTAPPSTTTTTAPPTTTTTAPPSTTTTMPPTTTAPPTTTTTAPPSTTTTMPPTTTTEAGAAASGYWLLEADGTVHGFGAAGDQPAADQEAVDLTTTSAGVGLWVLLADGTVRTDAAASFHGRLDLDDERLRPGERPSSISVTPTGSGYWIFTDRGQAFAFGDAAHYGDLSEVVLNGPIVASTATPTGRGYYLVGSDGGVFSYGDAAFRGSMGGIPLNGPVVGLAPDPDGVGYWLVSDDGGIFAFDADFRGSMGGTPLNQPVRGGIAYADGYLMVAADGGIFNFSTSPFLGSLGDNPPSNPIVAVTGFPR